MTGLDYETVSRYWDQAAPSVLGPYMMGGFGFPAGAGRFRFRAECRIVERLIQIARRDGSVLDLGSGIGCWTEYFAQQFARVVTVEASRPLFEALKERCASLPNVEYILGDVMRFEPEDQYELVFLGGMLMYLNEQDVSALLRKLIQSLRPGGIILCRETTIRQETISRQGEYQAVYRSVSNYQRIFAECGLSVVKVQMNAPYVLMQMGCEFVKKWKTHVPARLQCLAVLGRLVYWGLRIGNPWIMRIPPTLGCAYPELTNHFFVLQTSSHVTSSAVKSTLPT
jgi:trans-aconitate methyltransferase